VRKLISDVTTVCPRKCGSHGAEATDCFHAYRKLETTDTQKYTVVVNTGYKLKTVVSDGL
jgi:hypothetical protein